MATAALPLSHWNSSLAWLRDFLREELSPYPGRGALVARMVIAATLITIVGLTFRIPYTFQGAIYALMISRESPQATLKSAGTILLLTSVGTAYLLFALVMTMAARFDELRSLIPPEIYGAFNPNDKTNLAPYRLLHFVVFAFFVVRLLPRDWPGVELRIF